MILFVCDEYDLDSDLNNVYGYSFNENFYEHGHCSSAVAFTLTHQIIIILSDTGLRISRIVTKLYENDILEGVYCVAWDESNIINGISSGM